jgi:guanine deaminase
MDPTTPQRTIYCGAFVHSLNPQSLDICNKAAIGVDEAGKIAFIERDVADFDSMARPSGWESAKLAKVEHTGFFFPGFIGEYQHIQTA